MIKYSNIIIVLLLLTANIGPAQGSESGWTDVGARWGIQAGPKREYFHLYQAFADYGLPWNWHSTSGWGITTQLNASLGVLHKSTDTGIMGTLGPEIIITKTGFHLTPEFGINLNLMDRRQFGTQDFGSILLFGAYAGLSYRFDNGIGLGYRILHMSNNHILYSNNTPNPGVDMHQIGLSWNF